MHVFLLRRLLRLLVFLLLFLLLAFAGNWIFVRPDTFAVLTLQDLRHTPDAELVFVGSSVVRNHINPEILREETGKRAINAGIPCLSLPGAIALTEDLYRSCRPETVVLVLEPSLFGADEEDIEAENILMPYLRGMDTRLRYYRTLVQQDHRYLDRLFLYRTFSIRSVTEMFRTLTMHFCPQRIDPAPISQKDRAGHYEKSGFVRFSTEPCPGKVLRQAFRREPVVSDYSIRPETVSLLKQYRDLTRMHGSRLLILLFPNISAAYLSSPGILGYSLSLERFCAEENIPFINFGMAGPDLLPSLDPYYYDPYHFGGDGVDLFSHALGRCLRLLSEGQDISPLFYPDKWSFLLSLNPLPNVWIDRYEGQWNYSWEQAPEDLPELREDQFLFLANANHLPGATPLYAFAAVSSDGSESFLTEYRPNGMLVLNRSDVPAHLRVYARLQDNPGLPPVSNDFPESSDHFFFGGIREQTVN